MEKLFQNILDGKDIRQNLSALRKEIKDPDRRRQLESLVGTQPAALICLLDSDDAKTRKNAALLMGELALPEFRDHLFQKYTEETTLFVKESYLTALSAFDCSPYLNELKNRLNELSKLELTPDIKKHTEAEMRALGSIILSVEGAKKHTFTGYHEKFHCILLTNRLHKNVTADQIQHGTVEEFPAGLLVTTEDLEELLYLRTYSELLFAIPGVTTCSANPQEAAVQLASSSLLSLLKKIHREPAPFYFRIGVKSSMPLDKKSTFVKSLSSELERLTKRDLLNTASDYELEIRLIENKSHTFNVMVKLNTIPDERFSYRRESVAASMKPVNAALLVELAKDYMVPDAQILDPFCGVATLLIERQMVVKGNTSYGIDAYPDAIDKAKINMDAAGQIIHFVNKDCFEFTHDYLFDEIFTDMPFETGHKSDEEIYEIYRKFFDMAGNLLTEDGTIIMYSRNPEYVRSLSKGQNYHIIKEWEIMDKENAWLFILR
ncbi:MAG: methyltransferase [Hespellia sp.]|nr:methyltransferase [Hespellia sp.]